MDDMTIFVYSFLFVYLFSVLNGMVKKMRRDMGNIHIIYIYADHSLNGTIFTNIHKT